jgi:FixJ family two-component response regulator
MNLTPPNLDGLELQKCIADRFEVPIIFMTGHDDVSTTVRAMKAGALEVVAKPFNDEVMASAIGSAIEHSRTALSREAHLQTMRARYSLLSFRERQVMALVTRGMLNKLVAAELGISETTVKAHRGSMMRKMEARSLAELITMAAKLSSMPEPSYPLRRASVSYLSAHRGTDLTLRSAFSPRGSEGYGAQP